MQTRLLKIIPLTLIVLSFAIHTLAQDFKDRLKTADSLFNAKLYTQSFDAYHELLANNIYTPAMLLKMAFIQEGLGHLGLSLYYLSTYSNLMHDAPTGEKIKEIAVKNNLEGYDDPYSKQQMIHFLADNRMQLTLGLITFSMLLLAIIVVQKQKGRQPNALGIVLSAFLAILFWQINFSDPQPTAIISSSNTYLMEGPSSGAPVLAIVTEGHLLTIEGKYDVWLKTKWNGKEAFIKESALLPVHLN